MSAAVLQAFYDMAPSDADAWIWQDPAVKARIAAQIAHFPAWALPDIAAPTVICGCAFSDGVGEMWMVTGRGFRRTAPQVLRQQREICRMAMQAFGLHRMHILVDPARPAAGVWAEKLGFEFEVRLARMAADGSDRDMYLWANERKRA